MLVSPSQQARISVAAMPLLMVDHPMVPPLPPPTTPPLPPLPSTPTMKLPPPLRTSTADYNGPPVSADLSAGLGPIPPPVEKSRFASEIDQLFNDLESELGLTI